MAFTCCVVGCHNLGGRDKVSFYHIPAVKNHQGEQTAALSSKRRLDWVARIIAKTGGQQRMHEFALIILFQVYKGNN